MKKTAKTANGKTKEKKPKLKTEKFDEFAEHRFRCNVRLGPGKVETIEFSVKNDEKRDGHLAYDFVEFAAFEEMDSKYPSEYYPKKDIDGNILIKGDDGKWYPVVPEWDKAAIKALEGSKKYDRFLVLPEATYSIAPEYALYLSMVKEGIIDQNKVEYDYEKMHKILGEIEI